MAKVHVAISDDKLAPYLIDPIALQFNVRKWDSPDEMLQSSQLQVGDVAVVSETWASENKDTLLRKEFPRFIILLKQKRKNNPSNELAKSALKWLEAGAIECLAPDETPQQIKGVMDFAFYRDSILKPKPEKFRGLWMILSFSLVLMVLVLFASLFKKDSPLFTADMPKGQTFFHVLTPSPFGIAVDGKNVWIGDWYSQALSAYTIAGDLQLEHRFTFKDFSPSAIAISPQGLWSLGSDRKLRLHSLTETFPILKEYKLGLDKLAGLSWDGTSLWSTMVDKSEIVRLELGDLVSYGEQFPIEAEFPVGLVVKKKKISVLDGKTGKILFYDRKPNRIEFRRSLSLEYFAEGMNRPAGFGGDDDALWVTADKSGLVCRVKL